MELAQAGALLDPTPLPLETGFERGADGVLHVACRTDMPSCTGAMFEWWFRWRCDTQKYVWWHPVDHVYSAWAGELHADTHVGSEHVVTEFFTGLPAENLTIQFRDPAEFFDPAAYTSALASGAISCAVVGRTGATHEPQRSADGAVIGGRLLHIGRDTPSGLALRSHFFLGQDLPAAGLTADEVVDQVTETFGVALLRHCYNEFTFLSRFLPSLYLAEHSDRTTPVVPW